MRIFLICLSLIYVLGVSYTQRFSMGGRSCDFASNGFSINSGQTGFLTQHESQVGSATGTGQRQFGASEGLARAGNHTELGHVGVTRAGGDPCLD